LLNGWEAGEVGFGDVDLSLAGALSFVASDVAQPPRAARQAKAITSLRFNSRVMGLHSRDWMRHRRVTGWTVIRS